MREPSLGVKLTALTGLAIGLIAACWLVSISSEPRELIPRLGFVCAGICATACSVVSWAAIFAYIIRKMNWTPKSCVFAGLSLAVPGLLVFFSNSLHSFWLGILLVTSSTPTTYLCRRLAFPELTDEQASAPPPPIRLFGK
jgi:hypothetical protein